MIRNLPIFILLLALALPVAATVAHCAKNPFLSGGGQEETGQNVDQNARQDSRKETTVGQEPAAPGLVQDFYTAIAKVQKEIRSRMTGFARDIRHNPWGGSLWLFMLFAFAYGAVHALGPGHGKTVVCSYFLSRPGSLGLGVLMGNLITLVHVGSATLLVCAAFLLLKTGMGGFENFSAHLQTASFALITCLGVALTLMTLNKLRKGTLLVSSCDPRQKTASLKNVLAVSFVTGMVPCPGAAIILAFSLTLGILPAGLAAMFFLALGMGLTTTLFALAAVGARKTTAKAVRGDDKRLARVYAVLSLTGSLAITAFGAVMLSGSL